MQNTVNNGVAQVHVGRSHVDFRAQTFFSVRIFSVAHFAEQFQVFLRGTRFIGAFLSGLGQRAAGSGDFFGRKVVHKSLAFGNQAFGIGVNGIEKVGSVHFFRPVVPQPADVALDCFHEFRFFFRRVGIVEEEVALAAVFFRRAEVHQHAFYVPDVQITVGFGRKARLNFFHFTAFDILVDDLFDEVRRVL